MESRLTGDPLTENMRLAVACGADAAMLVAVAAASMAPANIEDALEKLSIRADEIARIVAEGPTEQARRPATLEADLVFEPELARIRPDLSDHEIRGKLLFRDIVGRRSFFQVAALAIGGLDLADTDAQLLEHLGVNTQLMDARIWPLAVVRRVAARGGGLAHALVAGIASLCTPNMAVRPVGGFMRFLDRFELELEQGRSSDDFLDELAGHREKIPGLGRPVLGQDERVPQVVELVERFGRRDGRSFELAFIVDDFFAKRKNVRVNSAGLQGAVMRDLGFSPAAASAFCMLYFIVPVLAQAVFSAETAHVSLDA